MKTSLHPVGKQSKCLKIESGSEDLSEYMLSNEQIFFPLPCYPYYIIYQIQIIWGLSYRNSTIFKEINTYFQISN